MRIMGCTTQAGLDELAAEFESYRGISERGLQKLRDSITLRRRALIQAGKKEPPPAALTKRQQADCRRAINQRSAESKKRTPARSR